MQQCTVLKISLGEYKHHLEHILTWLRRYPQMASQEQRITDTRLSDWLPPGSRVYCKRCGRQMTMTPCVDCLLNGHPKDLEDDFQDTWHLQWRLHEERVAPEATTAMPGTPEKLEVMSWRLLNGYSAFHPNDPVLPKNHLR